MSAAQISGESLTRDGDGGNGEKKTVEEVIQSSVGVLKKFEIRPWSTLKSNWVGSPLTGTDLDSVCP